MRRLVVFVCALVASTCVPAAAVPSGKCPGRVERVAGGSWVAHPVDDLRGDRSVWRLATDEGAPRFVAIADSEGILVSRDGGCSWTRAADYADFVAPLPATPLDAVVAGSGGARSLHVLVGRWAWAEAGPTLLSSFDDGATWTATGVPAPAGPYNFVSFSLTASPRSPGAVYLLIRHPSATGGVYAGSGRDDWRRQSTTAFAAPESCAPGDTCVTRTIEVLQADPGTGDVLWAFAGPTTDPDFTLGRSGDGGRSWEHRVAPDVLSARPLLDVAPGRTPTITLVGAHARYAVSTDGAQTWAVGRLPEVGSDPASTTAFDVAHFDGGDGVAALLGRNASSRGAGNVFVFDGRRWTDVSPRAFSGYDRVDREGRPLTFAALASTDDQLLALTSRGDLMSFRR